MPNRVSFRLMRRGLRTLFVLIAVALAWMVGMWLVGLLVRAPWGHLGAALSGSDATQALVMSQVVLSLTLPIPMIALVLFTRRRDIMGEFANRRLTDIAAIAGAAPMNRTATTTKPRSTPSSAPASPPSPHASATSSCAGRPSNGSPTEAAARRAPPPACAQTIAHRWVISTPQSGH